MNIKQALLEEHSLRQTNRIVSVCSKSPAKFGELMACFLSHDYALAQRAAWSVGLCAEKNEVLLKPYWGKILKNLKRTPLHDAVKRCTMRMLQSIVVDKRYHGHVIEQCFEYLLNKNEAIAVRVFAMSTLEQLLKFYPELSNELVIIIENELAQAPKPAFFSRSKKVLKTIYRIKSGIP